MPQRGIVGEKTINVGLKENIYRHFNTELSSESYGDNPYLDRLGNTL
jgi:hypothetical protein